MTAPVHLSFFPSYVVGIITMLVMETKRYYHGHLDRTDDGPPLSPSPRRDWGRNACVSCDNNTNGTLHMGQTDRLLGND